jgi:HKD family nuclease
MELLLSNYQPAKFKNRTTQNVWLENLSKSEQIRIATGFISSASLIELKKIIEVNEKPRIEMLIGMHYFNGFTKQQYDSALALNKTLQEQNRGIVYLSDAVPFHGKLYSFCDTNQCFSAIMGSSNLSSCLSSNKVYEADCFFEKDNANTIDKSIQNLFGKLGKPITNFQIETFIEYNDLLENHYGVKKITPTEHTQIWNTKTDISFEIPIKTEAKSNLNVYFGKGRVNQRGFEMPRPWYEVEIVVPVTITQLPNYPAKRTFDVVTDDGWRFSCKTTGDYGKNLRSSDDLLVLGKWIKGKLEQNNALTIGMPVTKGVLLKYGKETMKLSATTDPNVWIIEF